jgi:hypothetical protein
MMEMWMLNGRHYRRLSRLKVAIAVMGGIGLATAGVGAATSLTAAGEQASAETNATNSADQIQEQANQNQVDQYNQTRAGQAPYREAGYGALNTITQDQANGAGFATPWDPSQLSSTPGYQFTLDQGNQAIQRSAAAQGGLLSGAAAKAIDQYTTGLADQTYNQQYSNYLADSNQSFNQLASAAGLGQNSLTTTANAGTASANATSNTANSMAQNTIAGTTGAANATASGMVGASNSLSAAGGTLSNYYMLNQAGLLGGSPTYANSPAYYPGAQTNPYTNQVDQENEMSSLGASY